MTQTLSRYRTSQVISRLEELLSVTLYDYLTPSQVQLCRAHLAEVKTIVDDFDVKVEFSTVPQIRQTVVSFTLTPKTKAVQ